MGVVTNWGTAIASSLATALSLFFSFIPRLVGFLVILVVGWIVAAILEKAVTLLLRRVGFDRMSDRIGLTRFEQRLNMRMDPAALLGKIVFWFVFLIFLVPACNALELTSVSSIINSIVAYLPNVFVAIVVLLLGMIVSTFAADIVIGAAPRTGAVSPKLLANIVRYAIIGFVTLVALEQLQIAPVLITTLFTAIVGSIALACGLAFGLGGRDSARHLLERGSANVGMAGGPASQLDMQDRFNQSPRTGSTMGGTGTGTGAVPNTPVSTPTTPGVAGEQTRTRNTYPEQQSYSGQANPGQKIRPDQQTPNR
ncbi:mechanosensitive ion channel family protein [Dictyobacter arantiisoli]|uniref:Small-conductance mechanosensitive ion channel n=1 Tax=Dictyobacter arantiisoli TaxID=2014874 RepID=A0A5A5T5Q4_9CHLR|nr:small-conductance mechanosensitive ion channel [Dictyobacter arantiisoli]GCF06668.1 hypothetical protein KDI_02320 [Dictyobacter arantiisoli]